MSIAAAVSIGWVMFVMGFALASILAAAKDDDRDGWT